MYLLIDTRQCLSDELHLVVLVAGDEVVLGLCDIRIGLGAGLIQTEFSVVEVSNHRRGHSMTSNGEPDSYLIIGDAAV